MNHDFKNGLKAASPIILGYIPVGIAYGMMAKASGLTFMKAMSFSVFVYAGASQMASVQMLKAGIGFFTIVLTVFVLNLRHIIMSTCIIEKIEKTPLPVRLLLSFGITDEVFALSMTSSKQKLNYKFFGGIVLASYLAWLVGSMLGILFSSILPDIVSKALGISLYAMFIGLLVPSLKKSIRLFYVVIITMVLSYVFNLFLSSSYSTILACLLGALIGMLFIKKEDLE